jgi:histidine triad (HIT) family protein
VVAFWDAYPTAPIHILIVPRNHVPTLNDLREGDGIFTHMGMVARKIAKKQGIAESGYRFFINVGKGGGQVVFHLHAHLVGGRDLGIRLIELAVGAAILWRKIVNGMKGPPGQ